MSWSVIRTYYIGTTDGTFRMFNNNALYRSLEYNGITYILKMLCNVAYLIGLDAYLLGSVDSSVCWLQRRTTNATSVNKYTLLRDGQSSSNGLKYSPYRKKEGEFKVLNIPINFLVHYNVIWVCFNIWVFCGFEKIIFLLQVKWNFYK